MLPRTAAYRQNINDAGTAYRCRGSPVGKATRYGLAGDRVPVGGEIFRTRSDCLWGQSSLLYNGYRVFPGGKASGAWRWQPTHIYRLGWRKSRAIALLPLWAFVVCCRMNFTFTFNACRQSINNTGCRLLKRTSFMRHSSMSTNARENWFTFLCSMCRYWPFTLPKSQFKTLRIVLFVVLVSFSIVYWSVQ